jgi:hypothetical protein
MENPDPLLSQGTALSFPLNWRKLLPTLGNKMLTERMTDLTASGLITRKRVPEASELKARRCMFSLETAALLVSFSAICTSGV